MTRRSRSSSWRSPAPLRMALLTLPLVLVVGCDGDDLPTAQDGQASAGVNFSLTHQDGTPAVGELRVDGTNGSLVITEMAFVVDEIELEGTRGTHDFEQGPLFIESLLQGPVVAISSTVIPPGRYDELEFEMDGVDDDDEILEAIRTVYPDWPKEASLFVAGRFEESNGEVHDVYVFIEAEVEIELDLNPPLVIEEFEEEVLVVSLAPGLWFSHGDGSVIDLSAWNYIPGSDLPELEVEIEDGAWSVEWDD